MPDKKIRTNVNPDLQVDTLSDLPVADLVAEETKAGAGAALHLKPLTAGVSHSARESGVIISGSGSGATPHIK
jgi:hypothetical protein